MPTALAHNEAFAAVAEPKRRRVLASLRAGEQSVNTLVGMLRWPQPQVSKHLRILREANLVHVRHDGRQRIYRLNAAGLKPIHDWVSTYEQFWSHQLLRIKARAEAGAHSAESTSSKSSKE
jgi:DNA-binding transcriptional ArsR family regulator